MMTLQTKADVKYLPDLIGKGYGDFWRFKGRYRVCKGSRASKKSKTTGLYYITKMIQHPDANLLVIRKTERTLKDSCYKELKWAMQRLGVEHLWKCNVNPLEMTYEPTGQKIYFRGLDDPLKVTSITVDKGHLCWCWIEEAYEINKEEDFDMLDESIRGQVPPGLWKQITLTFNPWTDKHWIKKRFFDIKSPDILAKTTNYMCNEWLDEADLKMFEDMKLNRPKRYRVAGLGDWGVVDGLVYENWEERVFDVNEVSKRPGVRSVFGLDFGYVNDPSALFCGLVDTVAKEIYVFDEMYEKAMLNEDICERITKMGYSKEQIVADCAETKSIVTLRHLGLPRVKPSRKGKGSVNNGIDACQSFKIIIHPRCVNFLTEISNYTWAEDKFGKKLNEPIDDFNHLMDAMRYSMEWYTRGSMVSFLK